MGFAGFGRAGQRLTVHPREREHPARLRVLRDRRDKAVVRPFHLIEPIHVEGRGLRVALEASSVLRFLRIVKDGPPEARRCATGEAHYWSRSRRRLWRKGETSGHVQKVREVRLDCDGDAILLMVEQIGGIACHTGRERCFHQRLAGDRWVDVLPVVKDPREIYGHG